MPSISSLIVFDPRIKKVRGEASAVGLEGISSEHITHLKLQDPMSHLEEVEKINEDNWLFHVRSSKGEERVLVKDRVVIPANLECFFVSKKAFPEGTKLLLNPKPFPHPEIDDPPGNFMHLLDYPFCCEFGGVWELITRFPLFFFFFACLPFFFLQHRAEVAETTTRDFDMAIKLYKEVIAIDPTNATAFCHIGMSLMEKGLNEEAEKWLKKAIDLDTYGTLAGPNMVILFFVC
jgi:tetratricopeptide (TPR) repeat protein